ncbi:MAG: arginase family protein [Dehalococcoidia bacterium]
MNGRLAVIGVPSGAGACGIGQEQSPAALRSAGLIGHLGRAGFAVTDLGDSPIVPWRPDRANPRAQNLDAIGEMVRTTAIRVAEALSERERLVLVIGGDCTVGIGTMAGVRQALGPVALAYFDLHADLNTPASAADGALDWMALGHMLAVEGSEQRLLEAAGPEPVIGPDRVVLVGHDRSRSTRFERHQIAALGLPVVTVDEVRADPHAAARRALDLLAARADHYAIHLDVDVVDFTDAPLSEHPSRNVGLTLDEMLSALAVLASGPGLVGLTLTELNPQNAAADAGLLDRFAARFAEAIAPAAHGRA